MEDLATEGSEVVRFTFRIGALDPRDALRVVPAIQEALHGLRDALPAKPAQPRGELCLVAGEEPCGGVARRSAVQPEAPSQAPMHLRAVMGRCLVKCDHIRIT
jgi:hypothetical protein